MATKKINTTATSSPTPPATPTTPKTTTTTPTSSSIIKQFNSKKGEYSLLNLSKMVVGKSYQITAAKTATTKYGPSILVYLDNNWRLYLSKRYNQIFSTAEKIQELGSERYTITNMGRDGQSFKLVLADLSTSTTSTAAGTPSGSNNNDNHDGVDAASAAPTAPADAPASPADDDADGDDEGYAGYLLECGPKYYNPLNII